MSQGLSGENTGNCAAVYYCIRGHKLDVHHQLAYIREVMTAHQEFRWVGVYCDVCPESGNAPRTALMNLIKDAQSGLFQIVVAPSITALSPDIFQELKQLGVAVYPNSEYRHSVNPWIEALRELMYAQ